MNSFARMQGLLKDANGAPYAPTSAELDAIAERHLVTVRERAELANGQGVLPGPGFVKGGDDG